MDRAQWEPMPRQAVDNTGQQILKQILAKTWIAKTWNNQVPDSIKEFPQASFLSAYKNHFMLEYKAFVCNDIDCYSCSTNYLKHIYR